MHRIIKKRSNVSRRITSIARHLSATSTTSNNDSAKVITVVGNSPSTMRQFSTRMHTVSSPSSPMLSPFLMGDQQVAIRDKNDDIDMAFMRLLKAMSVLKTSPVDDLMIGLVGDDFTKKATPKVNKKLNKKHVKATQRSRSINQRVQEAMASKRVDNVLQILYESMNHESSNEQLNDLLLGRVIHFLSYQDLSASFQALKFLVQRSHDQGKLVKLDIYRRVIQGIHHADHRTFDLLTLGEEIFHHIRDSFTEGSTVIYQHILLPNLVFQLVKHRDRNVNRCAKGIVEYMLKEEFPLLNPEQHEAILNEASHNRVGRLYIPFHKLLTELVSRGYRPQPSTVNNLLQCHFPFHDQAVTCELLHAIKQLATDSTSETKSSSSIYRVDKGTLESISMATEGCTELTLLVWDLAELFEIQPTECMFEDVVLSFGSTKSDKRSFNALLEMELSGYIPSSALLRQYAVKLSMNDRRLAHARHLLAYNHDGQYLSTSGINCLLLGYGMKKDLETAFELFENFDKYNIQADDNTYAFLMESLWLNVKDRVASNEFADTDVDDILAVIDTVVSSMQLAEVDGGKRFAYEHMRLLCVLKQVDEARALLEYAIENKVPLKIGSIAMIANGYVDRGDAESARDVANLSAAAGCGEPTFLLRQIENRTGSITK